MQSDLGSAPASGAANRRLAGWPCGGRSSLNGERLLLPLKWRTRASATAPEAGALPTQLHRYGLVQLAMHRAIARKIRREPKLYNVARRNLARWERKRGSCPAPFREWKEILVENDVDTVLRIISRTDEESDRLRQSSPFCGVLSQGEVEAIWASYDAE